jgi:hypothetical protein
MQEIKKYLAVESEKATHLKISLYYDKGGMNYFTGGTQKRGLYLSISPVSRSTSDKFVTESYTAFTGTKQLIKELKRFSDKALNEAAVEIFAEGNETKEKLIKHVCSQNNITLKQMETVS